MADIPTLRFLENYPLFFFQSLEGLFLGFGDAQGFSISVISRGEGGLSLLRVGLLGGPAPASVHLSP